MDGGVIGKAVPASQSRGFLHGSPSRLPPDDALPYGEDSPVFCHSQGLRGNNGACLNSYIAIEYCARGDDGATDAWRGKVDGAKTDRRGAHYRRLDSHRTRL